MSVRAPVKDFFRPLQPRAQPGEGRFPFGLAIRDIHEVCEGDYGDRAAALGFVVAHLQARAGPVVAITQAAFRQDQGRWHEAGLAEVTQVLPPLLHVHVRRRQEALWATEEAMRSSAVGLVVTEVDGLDFTQSRRLSLLTEKTGVPAVLLLPYKTEGATAAAGRWRVRSKPSAPNPFDPMAVGAPRWQATVDRLRAAPSQVGQAFDVEFNHETLSVDLVS